jgi:hypothetical protein
MTEGFMKRSTLAAAVSVVAASLTASAALAQEPSQDPAQTGSQIVAAQKANRAALTQYTWKMRADVRVSGEAKGSMLFQVSFDSAGKGQLAPADTGQPAEKRGGLRGKRDEKKTDELHEKVAATINLSRAYATMTTGQMVDFFEKATMSPGTSDMVGTTQAQGRDVLQSGDQVSMWFDPQTKQLRRLVFRSALENVEVNGTLSYSTMPDGPTHSDKAVITMPSKSMEVTVESSEFVKQGAAKQGE